MNKKKITEQILGLISIAEAALQLRHEPYFGENYEKVNRNLHRVKAAFSGSWLGYHANVYYLGFETPAPGDRFSVEWGFGLPLGGRMRPTNWIEVTFEQVKVEIMNGVDSDYERRLNQISKVAKTAFEEAHGSIISLLAVLVESKSTKMLEDLSNQVGKIVGFLSTQEIINYMTPRRVIMTRDSSALSQGDKTPPHAILEAWHLSEYSPFEALANLTKESNTLLKYMEMHDLVEYAATSVGLKVFIGHGHSPLWRELKDFIEKRLFLEWDEFNREPTAGFSRKERLQSMLDQACFAFLLMTGEDQHADDTIHARENVVHEVGLFQGRLGFRKAIVLLEEGCAEFSNIEGISQIRFPKGNISASFEDIRRVLEREGVLRS
jgi:predicted nucleotide-binding protein